MLAHRSATFSASGAIFSCHVDLEHWIAAAIDLSLDARSRGRILRLHHHLILISCRSTKFTMLFLIILGACIFKILMQGHLLRDRLCWVNYLQSTWR